MITHQQQEELAKNYQIDTYTVFREYLQLVFLSYLYQRKEAEKIYFKGGTAIHLLCGSPRFSEDLDFLTPFVASEIKKVTAETEKQIQKELPEFKISPLWAGRKTLRLRIKHLTPDFKYPFVIRLDFSLGEKPIRAIVSPLLTKFPIAFFPLVSHLSAEEILAEKICALLTRSRGRDLFDLWFLLEKGIKIEPSLVEKKLEEEAKKFSKEQLIKKIKAYPIGNLKKDLDKFLPVSQRKLTPILKEILLKKIGKR